MTDPPAPEYVRPRQRLDGPVDIAEPNPCWADEYLREQKHIRAALGSGALVIEHVGSTSAPGLAAKPILDIVLVVADSADEPTYVPALAAAGYWLHLREPGWFEHRLLKRERPLAHLHVFPYGCVEVDDMVSFRDRLRQSPADRLLYERTKRELAARRWAYGQDYADAKSAVVREILTRATAARPQLSGCSQHLSRGPCTKCMSPRGAVSTRRLGARRRVFLQVIGAHGGVGGIA